MNSNEIDYYLENNNQKNQVKDALFTIAEVLEKNINVLIDTGSKRCVITKRFLDKMGRNIDEPSNVWVVNIMGHKSVLLGRVKDIPIQLGTKITLVNMLVTEYREYNIETAMNSLPSGVMSSQSMIDQVIFLKF